MKQTLGLALLLLSMLLTGCSSSSQEERPPIGTRVPPGSLLVIEKRHGYMSVWINDSMYPDALIIETPGELYVIQAERSVLNCTQVVYESPKVNRIQTFGARNNKTVTFVPGPSHRWGCLYKGRIWWSSRNLDACSDETRKIVNMADLEDGSFAVVWSDKCNEIERGEIQAFYPNGDTRSVRSGITGSKWFVFSPWLCVETQVGKREQQKCYHLQTGEKLSFVVEEEVYRYGIKAP